MMRRLAERVVLCGIGYRVQESEGLIVFTDDNAMIGRPPRRFSFHRENLCWYVQLQYNPLKDGELVDFHHRQDVPAAVKQRAEMLASQWRRLIHTTGEWQEMQKNDPPTQLQQFKNTP